MIKYFSMPYPDELLYSVVARYFKHLAIKNKFSGFNQLFDSQIRPYIQLTNRITTLCEKTPLGQYYDSASLIKRHTLFPYYACFIGEVGRNKLLSKLMGNKRINTFGSISGGFFQAYTYSINSLQFCPKCAKEDVSKYGEPYWHRIHTIPGIHVCAHHNIPLLKLCSVYDRDKYKEGEQAFVFLDERDIDNCYNISKEKAHSILCTADAHFHYAIDSWNVLTKDIYYEPEELKNKYYSKLIELEMASIEKRLYQHKIKKEFLEFYSDDYLKEFGSFLQDRKTWLIKTLRMDALKHPIKQLLIIRWLFGSYDNLEKADSQYAPFGKGPWLCLNPVADHYLQKIVTNHDIRYLKKKIYGKFSCVCGFEYSRWIGDDEYQYRKVIKHGSVWEAQLTSLLVQKNLTKGEIAKRLGLKSISEYGIDGVNMRIPGPRDIVINKSMRQFYRRTIKNLVKKFPTYSRNQIRTMAEKAYSWLITRDKEWLMAALPSAKHREGKQGDWHKKDKEMGIRIRESASLIREREGKPQRVTKGEIIKVSRGWKILRFKDKFILSNVELVKLVESIEEYQMRCITWAVSELRANNEIVTEQKIRKLIKIYIVFAPEVKEYMLRIISENE